MTAKQDALVALREVNRMLQVPGTLVMGLAVVQVLATLSYAIGCVEIISETKRPRRTPKEAKS